MLKCEGMTKSERKQYIKKIEMYFKNYQNYKTATKNLEKQLGFLSSQKNYSDRKENPNNISTSI